MKRVREEDYCPSTETDGIKRRCEDEDCSSSENDEGCVECYLCSQ